MSEGADRKANDLIVLGKARKRGIVVYKAATEEAEQKSA